MARPGYIDARTSLYRAQKDLEDARQALVEAESLGLPFELRELRLQDAQKLVEKYVLALAEAERVFDSFRVNPKEARERVYYPHRILANVSVTQTLRDAIQEEQDKGTPLAQIVRAALLRYFGLE